MGLTPGNKILKLFGQNYREIGHGANNKVYASETNKYVMKFQTKINYTDTPERSVRIWNEINHGVGYEAKVVLYGGQEFWTCPYIEGRQATDAEICSALQDIFERTGRIVIDAPVKGNFIKSDEYQRAICVDIGAAFKPKCEDVESDKRSVVSNSVIDDFDPVALVSEYGHTHPLTTKKICELLGVKL